MSAVQYLTDHRADTESRADMESVRAIFCYCAGTGSASAGGQVLSNSLRVGQSRTL